MSRDTNTRRKHIHSYVHIVYTDFPLHRKEQPKETFQHVWQIIAYQTPYRLFLPWTLGSQRWFGWFVKRLLRSAINYCKYHTHANPFGPFSKNALLRPPFPTYHSAQPLREFIALWSPQFARRSSWLGCSIMSFSASELGVLYSQYT